MGVYLCLVVVMNLIDRRTEGKQRGLLIITLRRSPQGVAAPVIRDSVPFGALRLPQILSVSVGSDIACLSTPPEEGILTVEGLAKVLC